MENQIVILESEKRGVIELTDTALRVQRINKEVSIDIFTNDSRIEAFTDPEEAVRIKLPGSAVVPEWYKLKGFRYGYGEEFDYELHFSDLAYCDHRAADQARIDAITKKVD